MHVVVNAATSADGKLSTRRREQVRISGPEDFDRVARLRADSDAVLVGVGTVLADDPHLALDDEALRAEREARGDSPHPARVVVDSEGRTPLDARILDGVATTYLLVSEAATAEQREALADAGAEVVVAGGNADAGDENADDAGNTDGSDAGADDADSAADCVSLPAGLSELAARGVDDLMVEGGGEVIFSLFAAGLVDELSVYVGSLVVGGRDAPTLADGPGFVDDFPQLSLQEVTRVDDGVLLRYAVEGRGGGRVTQ